MSHGSAGSPAAQNLGAAHVTQNLAPPPAFPLSAIVGQHDLIQALLINAVAPAVGGVLIRGQRGTAKTTAVRGLASLLAPAPLVELPLGTTLDRLVGAIDLRQALDGSYAFEAGLLAKADGGILYVDEVNLLADHLVDALLDAAATGVARVEREAISLTHAARFLLVGTMNVEEGELRPQLLDRFGLGIEVTTPTDPYDRAEIVRRRLAFEAEPDGFLARWHDAERALAARIVDARERLDRVMLPERELARITTACAELAVDGVRGDITTARAARALAALDGEDVVTPEHVRAAAALALAHRHRRDPLDGSLPPADDERLAQALQLGPDSPDDDPPAGGQDSGQQGSGDAGSQRSPAGQQAAGAGASGPGAKQSAAGPPQSPRFDPSAPARESLASPIGASLPFSALALRERGRGPGGRHAPSAGRAAGSIDSRPAAAGADDLAVIASLRARLLGDDPRELREHVRGGRESVLICMVVDASGSMGARRRAARVKGALDGLLREAYARRDRIAVIAFRDHGAQLLVAPGVPLEQAAAALRSLPTGGTTPLAQGLATARRVIASEHARDPDRRAVAVLLTDGRVRDRGGRVLAAARALGGQADSVVVIDTEDGPVRVGLAAELASAAGGRRYRLQDEPVRRAA